MIFEIDDQYMQDVLNYLLKQPCGDVLPLVMKADGFIRAHRAKLKTEPNSVQNLNEGGT